MKNSKRGFSLVEVTVASAMAASMCLGLTLVMQGGNKIAQTNNDQMSTSFELRRGINSVAPDLVRTRSDQLWRPAGGGGWAAWANNDLAAYNSIRFRVPQDLDGNGTVLDAAGVLEWSPNFFNFELGGANGREIQRVERTAAGVEVSRRGLAYGVTALTFRRWPGATSVLEVSITVERGAVAPGAPTSGEARPVTLSTRVRMRVP